MAKVQIKNTKTFSFFWEFFQSRRNLPLPFIYYTHEKVGQEAAESQNTRTHFLFVV